MQLIVGIDNPVKDDIVNVLRNLAIAVVDFILNKNSR